MSVAPYGHTANYHLRETIAFRAATSNVGTPILHVEAQDGLYGGVALFFESKAQVLALAAAVGQMLVIAEVKEQGEAA